MENLKDPVQCPTKVIEKRKSKSEISKKRSHLYLQEKGLKRIPKHVPAKENILVLYLFSNNITKIEHLNEFKNLTSLYLQNNHIEKIENVKNLNHLRKLYIGHNKISVLEGLNSLVSLEELHIEKQRLPDNNSLCVDPRTIHSLSETLRVLNISNNNLYGLSHLSPLTNLSVIHAAFNDIDDIKDVCQTISNWFYLKEATFNGNPFTKKQRYREEIIANTCSLENLDGKPISDITRKFIRRFEEKKIIHGSKQSINIGDICPNLPSNYPPALKNAVSVSMIRNSNVKLLQKISTGDERDEGYVPWKSLPKRKPLLKTPRRLHNKLNTKGKKRVVINTFPEISEI